MAVMEHEDNHSVSKPVDNKNSSLALVKAKELGHIPVISKTYTNLRVKKRNNPAERWIKEHIEKIKEQYLNRDWKNSPIFEGYIELHDQYTEQKGIPSSSAALIDFILEKGSVPKINTFVDIYNVVSSFTGISIGAHDINKLAGIPRLDIFRQDMQFKMIGGSRDEVARKGEYGYVDENGVLCRMDIKQCDRTKVTESTKQVLMIFQGHAYLRYHDLKKGMQMLDNVILHAPLSPP
jgi:DNA/RNA-binding domain of Phe-tRNA-synthetase-like protein